MQSNVQYFCYIKDMRNDAARDIEPFLDLKTKDNQDCPQVERL